MAESAALPTASSARVAAYEACTHGERSDAIQQLGAALSAITAELLDVITAADRQEDWRIDGTTGMAAWLVGMCHLGTHTARDWVRVGAALEGLPHLRAAFAEGALSWDQIRPATTFATPDDDAVLAEDLPGWSAAQVDNHAAHQRRLRRAEGRRRKRDRHLTWRRDTDAGGCHYRGFLPDVEAEIVNTALTRLADQTGPDAETGQWDPFRARCADALVDLARQQHAYDPGPDPTLVVIHASADVVDGGCDGNGTVGGIPIPQHSVLRLLCDTAIEFNIDGPDGTCIGIGRAGRTVPRWLRRRILHRDTTCRFPGCTRPIRHIHHIEHWSQGGPTNSSNLLGVCWHHHHLVHEGHWSITGNADTHITFTSPHGRTLPSRPPPLRPQIRRRCADVTGIDLSHPGGGPSAGPAP